MKHAHYLAENCTLVGDVVLGSDASIWYGSVLRGDHGSIVIGDGSNIQDLCVIHDQTAIGKHCTIGHGAIVHGCSIGDGTTIGMGAIVLSGARIGAHCMVGAGALVTGKMDAPEGSLLLGSPAKICRRLSAEEIEQMDQNAAEYVILAKKTLVEKY